MINHTFIAMSLTAVVVIAAIPPKAVAGSGTNSFIGGVLGSALGSAITNSYYNNQRRQQQAQPQRTYKKRRTTSKKKRRTKPAAPPVSTEGVKVQTALRSAGYYSGPLNGKLDSYDSRAAIMQYQQRYGLLKTGVLSPDVKGVMLQQGDIAKISSYLRHTGNTQRDRARRLQAALKVQGFYTATIDGDFGPKSRSAMRLYQQAKGMTPSGALLPGQEMALVSSSVQLLQQQQAQTDIVLTQVAARHRSLQPGAPIQSIPVQHQQLAPVQPQPMPAQQQPVPPRYQAPPSQLAQQRTMPSPQQQRQPEPQIQDVRYTPPNAQPQSSQRNNRMMEVLSEDDLIAKIEAPIPPSAAPIEATNNIKEPVTQQMATLAVMTELKADADVFADTLAELPEGTQLTVNSIEGDWANISVNGQQGFVYAEFLGNQ